MRAILLFVRAQIRSGGFPRDLVLCQPDLLHDCRLLALRRGSKPKLLVRSVADFRGNALDHTAPRAHSSSCTTAGINVTRKPTKSIADEFDRPGPLDFFISHHSRLDKEITP